MRAGYVARIDLDELANVTYKIPGGEEKPLDAGVRPVDEVVHWKCNYAGYLGWALRATAA